MEFGNTLYLYHIWKYFSGWMVPPLDSVAMYVLGLGVLTELWIFCKMICWPMNVDHDHFLKQNHGEAGVWGSGTSLSVALSVFVKCFLECSWTLVRGTEIPAGKQNLLLLLWWYWDWCQEDSGNKGARHHLCLLHVWVWMYDVCVSVYVCFSREIYTC